MRFYLVDRITDLSVGESISGLKCWSMTDEFFNEHFPGFPVVPGVLVSESMAQLLGILIEKSFKQKFPEDIGVYAALTIIHKAKFKKFMIPGDQAKMKAQLTSIDKNMASGEVKVFVDEELYAKAEFSYALIPKRNLPNDRLAQMREEYFDILLNAKTTRDQLKSKNG